jgi:hypothetical protein
MLDDLQRGDRLIILRPTRGAGEPRYLDRIYETAGRGAPSILGDWEEQTELWCAEYRERWPDSNIVEVLSDRCVYVFDRHLERMVVPFGISSKPAFAADRGHFLAHATGGELDINLFPHRAELNRGTSVAGRRFREMERYVAATEGTFFYHLPRYDDETWIPSELEFGVLVEDAGWWVERFANKG